MIERMDGGYSRYLSGPRHALSRVNRTTGQLDMVNQRNGVNTVGILSSESGAVNAVKANEIETVRGAFHLLLELTRHRVSQWVIKIRKPHVLIRWAYSRG
jgi:hypothetical protein